MKDFYAILGITEDTEPVVVTAAYKALAKKYHPDVWKGTKETAEKKMRELNLAYETLSNEQSRKEYNAARNQTDPSPKRTNANKSQRTDSASQVDPSSNTIKIVREMLPKNTSLDGSYLTYKNKKVKISDIKRIKHTVTSTQHSTNFVKTHKSLEGELLLKFADDFHNPWALGILSNKGGGVTISANQGFFGDMRKYQNQKADVDKLSYLASLLMEATFKRRVSEMLQTDHLVLAKYGSFTIFKDGTVVDGGQHFSDFKGREIALSLREDNVIIFKDTNKRFFNEKLMDISWDREVILYILKHHLKISFNNTYVRDWIGL